MTKAEQLFINTLNDRQPESFRTLFIKHYALMVSFGMNYVDQTDVAEDIVQEIFTKIWENNTQFESYRKFKTFLYTSVRNAGLNYIKHEKVKERYNNSSLEPQSGDPELDIIEEEVYHKLFESIDSLPKRCREVFELHLDGNSNDDIASLLGLSVLTVKTQKNRAMQSLRKQMGDMFFIAVSMHIF